MEIVEHAECTDYFVDELHRMVFDEAVIAKYGYSMHATVWCDTEVL